jgi:alkylation response protein AidB-like acyl-CoA dehydrogenase
MSLAERASSLVPLLRDRALETERAWRVSPEVFDALAEAGVFRMLAPKRYGGAEADFQTQSDVLSELARGCPSASWVATIFSAMAWVVGTFPGKTQDEVLGDGDPRVHGAFSPTGTGVPRNGGLVVSGRWGFGTGCHGARWTLLNALVEHGDPETATCVVVPTGELTILDDWRATGMAGTGSNTIVAEEVFVPGHRCRPFAEIKDGASTGAPYYRYPLAPVTIVNAVGTPLGIARGALEAFRERMTERPITATTYAKQAEAPITHLVLGEAALDLDSADAHARRACAILDSRLGQPLSLEERVQCRAHVSQATGLARKLVDSLFHSSGATSAQEDVPIQRFQRDIQTLANHAVMNQRTTTELYGRILAGLEPNTPLV